MSEGLPIGLSLGVGSIAPGEGSQVSNYFTSGTLQQTDRNTLSLFLFHCHSSTVSHWWDTAADRQEYSLSLSFSFTVTLLLYLTGGTLQQTGRNTLSLSLSLSLFYCISLVGHCSRQAGILSLSLFLSSCHSSTVSQGWDATVDRKEYSISSLSFFYCI
jgi:hypothetical protein